MCPDNTFGFRRQCLLSLMVCSVMFFAAKAHAADGPEDKDFKVPYRYYNTNYFRVFIDGMEVWDDDHDNYAEDGHVTEDNDLAYRHGHLKPGIAFNLPGSPIVTKAMVWAWVKAHHPNASELSDSLMLETNCHAHTTDKTFWVDATGDGVEILKLDDYEVPTSGVGDRVFNNAYTPSLHSYRYYESECDGDPFTTEKDGPTQIWYEDYYYRGASWVGYVRG